MNSIFGNIDDLYLFCCVVEEGSLLAASRKLRLPVSTMSRRLSALESRLNTRLLEKQGRELVATQSGLQAFDLLSSGIESVETGFGQLMSDSDEVSGSIKLALPHSFYTDFVGELVEQFLFDYPNVNIDLVLSQEQVVPQSDRDLLMTFDITGLEDMIARPLFTAKHAFFASPKYLDSISPITNLDELAQCDWIAVDHVLDIPVYQEEKLVELMAIKPRLVVNDILSVFAAVEKGLGVASLPLRHLRDDMDIIRLFPQYHRSGRQAHLVYKQRRYQPKALTLFVDTLLDGVKNLSRRY